MRLDELRNKTVVDNETTRFIKNALECRLRVGSGSDLVANLF